MLTDLNLDYKITELMVPIFREGKASTIAVGDVSIAESTLINGMPFNFCDKGTKQKTPSVQMVFKELKIIQI